MTRWSNMLVVVLAVVMIKPDGATALYSYLMPSMGSIFYALITKAIMGSLNGETGGSQIGGNFMNNRASATDPNLSNVGVSFVNYIRDTDLHQSPTANYLIQIISRETRESLVVALEKAKVFVEESLKILEKDEEENRSGKFGFVGQKVKQISRVGSFVGNVISNAMKTDTKSPFDDDDDDDDDHLDSKATDSKKASNEVDIQSNNGPLQRQKSRPKRAASRNNKE